MTRSSLFALSADLLAERLDFVKEEPRKIAIVGADEGASAAMLAKKYPRAALAEFDWAKGYYRPLKKPLLRSLSWPYRTLNPLVLLPAGDKKNLNQRYDFLISNFFLVRARERYEEFLTWSQSLLKDKGYLFFIFLGLDSLRELWRALHLPEKETSTLFFRDMHDVGDDLLRGGFSEPVLGMEKIVLKYQEIETLMNDLEELGLLPFLFSSLKISRHDLRSRLLEKGMPPLFSLEVIFAHAVKVTSPPRNSEQPVHFYQNS